MIRYLRGIPLDRLPGELILDVGGVGYQVFVPDTLGVAGGRMDGEMSLYVHTHVREDAIQLYGFATREELMMFETLLGVSGVGPRLGLAIVSHLSPEALIRAVMNGEERVLTRIPGVGKKMAARMLLELKDKLKDRTGGAPMRSAATYTAGHPEAASAPVDDAVAALVTLGFTEETARQAVSQAAQEAGTSDVEALVKAALRRLDRKG